MVLLSSLNLHHQSFSPLLLLLQSASLDLVCHYSENSVVRLIFLFAFLLAFLKKGKTNAPAVYYFFWVMYIFLNSIGNTKTTTPSGGRWCKFLGTFTHRTRGRSRVTWTLQLPVESDDASSEAFSSASQESVPEVEMSLEWQPTPQYSIGFTFWITSSGTLRTEEKVPFDLSFVQMFWICPLTQVATTNVKQCKQ